MQRPIYIQLEEDLISILSQIKKSGGDAVVLVVPRGARILHSVTSLKLLRDQAEKMQKTIALATADERGQVLARRSGIQLVSEKTYSAPSPAATAMMRKSTGIGDIMVRRQRPAPQPMLRAEPTKLKKSRKPAENAASVITPARKPSSIVIPKPVKIPWINYKYVLPPVAAILLIAAVLVFYVLPHAEIIVKARTEPIARDLEVQVDSNKGVPDPQNLLIPGKKISEELEEAKTYQTTGTKNVGEKASGFVNIYNFTKSSIILKKGTTHLEANGKTYYFLQDVGSIRPTARIGEDLEIDPTSLIDPVPIASAESGETSNLPAGTRLEIFNEVFGHQSQVLYAMNSNPIAGGTTKQVKILSAGDVDAARKDLGVVFAEKLQQDVKGKITADSTLASNAFNAEVLQENLNHAVGNEAESFELKQKVRMNALVYSRTDVRDLIVERIVKLLPANKYLPSESTQGEDVKADFVSLDLNAGVGTLHAHFESLIRYKIEPDTLARSLAGKTSVQVKEILLARPEIQDVEVNLWPSWVRSVPRFSSKLDIKVLQ